MKGGPTDANIAGKCGGGLRPAQAPALPDLSTPGAISDLSPSARAELARQIEKLIPGLATLQQGMRRAINTGEACLLIQWAMISESMRARGLVLKLELDSSTNQLTALLEPRRTAAAAAAGSQGRD
jgi:hypothetical protein